MGTEVSEVIAVITVRAVGDSMGLWGLWGLWGLATRVLNFGAYFLWARAAQPESGVLGGEGVNVFSKRFQNNILKSSYNIYARKGFDGAAATNNKQREERRTATRRTTEREAIKPQAIAAGQQEEINTLQPYILEGRPIGNITVLFLPSATNNKYRPSFSCC